MDQFSFRGRKVLRKIANIESQTNSRILFANHNHKLPDTKRFLWSGLRVCFNFLAARSFKSKDVTFDSGPTWVED